MKRTMVHALLMLMLCGMALQQVTAYSQDGVLLVKNDKKEKASAPTPPKEPNFRLIDALVSSNVLISHSDWQALERYFDDFDRYAEEVDRELMKIKKMKNPKKRPKAPRMSLSNVATTDVPPLLRSGNYYSLSPDNRRTLEQNLKEMRDFIRETQALF